MFKSIAFIALAFAMSGCGNTHYEYSVGQKGDQGVAGATGAAGQDATPVTVVKFCPGVTVYPSKFIEIGFCIGGKLYGTYSANDGFSTELPPGTYGSNGINASCNFTVGLNCAIINN